MTVYPQAAEIATNTALPHKSLPVETPVPPPRPPPASSPVDLFRQLLAQSPPERADSLADRPPQIRRRILAKLSEYEALAPDERELRLRATELRWYLLPLLREPPTNRTAALAHLPNDLRDLAQARLDQWSILPPPLQNEFLENERTLHYFADLEPGNRSPRHPLPGNHRPPGNGDPGPTRWNTLSEAQRQKISRQFDQFFELTPEEKQITLNTLSDAERQQMEKTLQAFEQLPRAQCSQCIRAFTQFASLSPDERTEFLKNARRWSQMSPQERQTWRDLVAHVPEWAPVPPALMPPLPEGFPPPVATNSN